MAVWGNAYCKECGSRLPLEPVKVARSKSGKKTFATYVCRCGKRQRRMVSRA